MRALPPLVVGVMTTVLLYRWTRGYLPRRVEGAAARALSGAAAARGAAGSPLVLKRSKRTLRPR